MRLKIDGIEIAPCIVAKAKYALGLTRRKPTNVKTCSYEYWVKVVMYLGTTNHFTSEQIQRAIDKKYEVGSILRR